MNSRIAKILVDYLKPLEWVDKIAGMTQIAQVTQVNVVKKFPISCDVSLDDCGKGCYEDLMPSGRRKSILFFEDVSFNYIRHDGGRIFYDSRLRLVCWLNYKLTPGGCGASGYYVSSVIGALPLAPKDFGDLRSLTSVVIGQAPRTSGIFGKYTFDEKRSQYLMSPYDFFALDIRTTFFLIAGCEVEIPESCVEC